MNKFFLLIGLAILLVSCVATKKSKTGGSESSKEVFVEQDAKPPVGYRPNFVTALDKFRTDTSISYQARIIHSTIKNGKATIHFNITDNIGRLYLHANHEKWKKVWCTIEEKSPEKTVNIKHFQLTHQTELEHAPLALAFVLDHSASMGDLRIFTVQNAVSNLVQNDKKPGDAIAVIKYDQQVILEVPLTKDPDKFMELFKFSGLQQESGGMSAINDALDKAILSLDADTSIHNKAVIIFTDGTENGSKIKKSEVITKAKGKGIKLFTIDFGANSGEGYMEDLAISTGGCYYHIYRTNEFNFLFHDIYKRLKNSYRIEYLPSFFGENTFRLLLCNLTKKVEVQHSFINEPLPGNAIAVNVIFDPGKSLIKSSYKSEIERILKVINQNPNLKFEIRGHTDDTGNEKTNLVLSQKRAEAIKAELLKKGADPNRLTAKGFGKNMPVADNKTKEGKLLNRRIELVVIE
jgi:flagellar motor protein MotB